MKNLTRKITLSLVAILFAVIALGTTTYAWFTLGTTATVGTVSGSVTSGEGIEISLDGKTWVNTLSTEALTAYINDNAKNLNLTDLTKTTDGVGFVKNNGTTDGAEAVENADYLVLPIQVRAIGNAAKKTLYVQNVVLNDSGFNWTADVTVDNVIVEGQSYKVYASDAARVTFSQNDKCVTYYAEHTDAGIKGTDATSAETVENSFAFKYAEIKKYDTTKLPAFQANDTTYQQAKNGTESIDDKKAIVDSLPENQTAVTVNVYIWLNGYDQHCINPILGKSLNVSFEFVIDSTTQNN